MKTKEANGAPGRTILGGDGEGTLDRIEAIAYGVRARLEEITGYSRRVTDETVAIARTLGEPETDIERWVAERSGHLAGETRLFREIRALLDKINGTGPANNSKLTIKN